MGATSVTGKGQGSAAKYGAGNKGSEHMALGVHRLIGPRVVASGDLQLSGSGNGTVYFPELPGGPDLYCPFLSVATNFHAYWENFTATSFDIVGDDNQGVCWEIVKKGLWGSLDNNGPQEVIANT